LPPGSGGDGGKNKKTPQGALRAVLSPVQAKTAWDTGEALDVPCGPFWGLLRAHRKEEPLMSLIGAAAYALGPVIELAFMILAFSYGGSYFKSILKAAVIGSIAIILIPRLVWATLVIFFLMTLISGLRHVARFVFRNTVRAGAFLLSLQIIRDFCRDRRVARLRRRRRRELDRLWDEEYEGWD